MLRADRHPFDSRHARVGSIFDTISDVGDWFKGAFQSIPGSEWVEGAVNSGAGFLKDIANDSTGRLILVGITNAMLFPAVAGIAIPSVSGMQTIGPQIASVVWVVPNLAAGDGFVESYAAEITWRTEYLAQIFGLQGAAKTFLEDTRKTLGIAEVQSITQNVWRNYGTNTPPKASNELDAGGYILDTSKVSDEQLRNGLKTAGIDPPRVAAKYGVRQDAAAAALIGLLKRSLWDLNKDFDAKTGALMPSTKGDSISKNSRSSFSAAKMFYGKPPPGSVAVRPGPSDGIVSLRTAGIVALITAPLWAPRVLKTVKSMKRKI